eukprot:CAMPEP_0202861466 /NCGR_PEP_ID=MMETSP1391-20130828/2853_1 /ASSEMBLY_ACC=CAM_ASM_000867 /TAXON_ID=1034604 /ORGANISM="Chlamydomonas leiostraca, Strain SAG 11-49" /LENGTH=96 /DNA_ID=CAMNT_0049540859 /DNA_START=268 /DNA_END=556 /DNA_ORIENTATION=+
MAQAAATLVSAVFAVCGSWQCVVFKCDDLPAGALPQVQRQGPASIQPEMPTRAAYTSTRLLKGLCSEVLQDHRHLTPTVLLLFGSAPLAPLMKTAR